MPRGCAAAQTVSKTDEEGAWLQSAGALVAAAGAELALFHPLAENGKLAYLFGESSASLTRQPIRLLPTVAIFGDSGSLFHCYHQTHTPTCWGSPHSSAETI